MRLLTMCPNKWLFRSIVKRYFADVMWRRIQSYNVANSHSNYNVPTMGLKPFSCCIFFLYYWDVPIHQYFQRWLRLTTSRNQLHCTANLNFGLMCKKAKHCWGFVNDHFISIQLIVFLHHVLLLAESAQKFEFFKIAVFHETEQRGIYL